MRAAWRVAQEEIPDGDVERRLRRWYVKGGPASLKQSLPLECFGIFFQKQRCFDIYSTISTRAICFDKRSNQVNTHTHTLTPNSISLISISNNMHASKVIPTQPKKAIYIDSIASLSDPLSSMSSIFSLVSLLTMAYQVRTPLPSVQDRLLTLLHTMSPALRTEEQTRSDAFSGYSREEILNSFIHFLSPVLNGMAGMLELLSAVDAFARPEDFRQFWTLERSNLIRDFIESGGPLRGMQGYDVPFLEAFVKDSSCRICLGKNQGMLLLVPGDAEVGDYVWWDEDEQRLTVSRKGEDDLNNNAEAYLDDGSRMTVMAISSAT